MKKVLLPLILMVFGVVLLATALLTGDAEMFIVLFFIPVIYGGSILMMVGVLLVFTGFFLLFFLPFFEADETRELANTEKSYGGVVFIGPIPIVFGSNTDITRNMLYIGIVLAIILLLVYLFWFL